VRTLAHLSDLHFGRLNPATLAPLRRRLIDLKPDLVVVSGDLTQRARAHQFREARAFLDRLPGPQVVVPGNHDVPLYNLVARFLAPLSRYRRIVSAEIEPSFVDGEIAVLGVNTARALVFKGGRVSDAQLAGICKVFDNLRGGVTRILVAHHPFMERLGESGADIIIAGHAHATRVQRLACGTLMVQAGTATSRRTREEPNSFNVLRIAPPRLQVESHALCHGRFVRATTGTFMLDGAR